MDAIPTFFSFYSGWATLPSVIKCSITHFLLNNGHPLPSCLHSKRGNLDYSSSKFSAKLSASRSKKLPGSLNFYKFHFMYKESRNVLKLELNLKTVSFKALLLQMMNLSSRGRSRVSQSKLEASVPESGSAMAQSSVLVLFCFFPLAWSNVAKWNVFSTFWQEPLWAITSFSNGDFLFYSDIHTEM